MEPPDINDELIGGPYRAAVLPQQRAAPHELTVRNEPHELVIEGRRPRWPAVLAPAAFIPVWLVASRPGSAMVAGALLAALGCIKMFVDGGAPITLRIAHGRVAFRGSKAFEWEAALDDFRVVGVARCGSAQEERGFLSATVGARPVRLFFGFPPETLEWIEDEIRRWQTAQAGGRLVD
jgi:hypothetical protein